MPCITITDQEFGRAVAYFTGILARRFYFPYRIIGSSFKPPKKVELEIAISSLSNRLPNSEDQRTTDWPDTMGTGTIELTRDDILFALTLWAQMHHRSDLGRYCTGSHVISAGDIPLKVRFRLEQVPREEPLQAFDPF